jgi:hypothetical protein
MVLPSPAANGASSQIPRFCSAIAVAEPSTASIVVVTEQVLPSVVDGVAVHGTAKSTVRLVVVAFADGPTPVGPLFLSVTRKPEKKYSWPV